MTLSFDGGVGVDRNHSIETSTTRDRRATIHVGDVQENVIVPSRASAWHWPKRHGVSSAMHRGRPLMARQAVCDEDVLQLRQGHAASTRSIRQRVSRAREASEPLEHRSILVRVLPRDRRLDS